MEDLYGYRIRSDEIGEGYWTVTISANVPRGPVDQPEEFGNPSPEEIGDAMREMRGVLARLALKAVEDKVTLGEIDLGDGYESDFSVTVNFDTDSENYLEIFGDDSVKDAVGYWLDMVRDEDEEGTRVAEVIEERNQQDRRRWRETAAEIRAWLAEHPDADVSDRWHEHTPSALNHHGQAETADLLRDYRVRRQAVLLAEQQEAQRARAERAGAERERQAQQAEAERIERERVEAKRAEVEAWMRKVMSGLVVPQPDGTWQDTQGVPVCPPDGAAPAPNPYAFWKTN